MTNMNENIFILCFALLICLYFSFSGYIQSKKTPELICAETPKHLLNQYCESLIIRNSNTLTNQKE